MGPNMFKGSGRIRFVISTWTTCEESSPLNTIR